MRVYKLSEKKLYLFIPVVRRMILDVTPDINLSLGSNGCCRVWLAVVFAVAFY